MTTNRYEIITPHYYVGCKFADVPAGWWWWSVGDEEFDTIGAARDAIKELQKEVQRGYVTLAFPTLAIRRVGERYPVIGEIYTVPAA